MQLIEHILVMAAVTVFFLLFFLPERNFEDQFVKDAKALRDAIKGEPVFDRQAWEKEIIDFIQTYKGRINEELYITKLDEIETTFNNRAVKIV